MSDWRVVRPEHNEWRVVREPEQQKQQQFSPLHSAGIGISTAGNEIGHGILQPLLESGYLGNRIKEASQQVAAQRNALYQESKNQNPKSTMLGYGGGKILPDALAAYATGGGSVAARTPGFIKYLAPLLKGMGTGAAAGAAEYVNPDESRMRNALIGGLTGAATGALPTAYGAVKGAASYGKHVPRALNKEGLIQDLAEGVSRAESRSSELFGPVLKESKKLGLKTEVPVVKLKTLREGMPTDEWKILSKYIENPTIKNAHNAYKDLGLFIREEGARKLNTPEKNTLRAAKKARDKIKSNMLKSFETAGRNDLKDMFLEGNKHYIEQVLPHRHSIIKKFESNRLTPEDFLRDLSANKDFKAQLGKQYPALGVRKSLPYVAGTIGAVPTGYAAYKTLFGG